MALEKITYYVDGKKKTVEAKVLRGPFEKALGLMFRRNPKPLFFTSNSIRWLPITSVFCRPFRAIWLDEKMHSVKVLDVRRWKININGEGEHLLEIPLPSGNNKSSSGK